MGFDKSDGQPLIHVRRWATKVNFAMALGVIVFLGLGVFAICWMHSHKNKVANDIQQKM
jgi:cbb3-type cytochrome oxidase subunit 3